MAKIVRVVILIVLGALIARLLRRSDADTTPTTPAMQPVPPAEPAAQPGHSTEPEAIKPDATVPSDDCPAAATGWVDATNGDCPDTHPVKLKLSSGIFHIGGQLNYDRMKADRCYCDEASAVADGYRASKT